MSTAASMLMDFFEGFFNIDLSNDKKSKLGVFGKALGSGVSGGAVDSTPLPTMEQPTRVSNKSNPSFATITTQLEDLIRTANKIGVYTKEQQEAILKQINQTKRVAKEQQLENKAPAVPELPETGDSKDLGPLDTSVNALIQRIDELSETVDGLSNGGMGGGMGGMPVDIPGGRRGRGRRPVPRIATPIPPPPAMPPAAAAGPSKSPSWLSRATAAVSGGGGGTATRVAAPIAAGAASSRVAGLMSTGLRSTKRAGGSIKSAVRKAAGPIITKALGRTVLKSIPIVGVGIGAAFAVGRLMQGDAVGAGVELASGVGGPLTAVPALLTSTARDTYATVYGIQPEQDPQFAQRYKELKGEIDQIAKEQLSGAVKTTPPPTDTEIGNTETPKTPPQAAPVKQPPPVPAVSPPAGATGGNAAASASPAAAATTGGGGATATGTPSGDAAATASSTGAPQQMTPEPTAGQALVGPTMETNATTGAMLTAQQMPVNPEHRNYGYNPTAGRFMPQTGMTSRGGAQGFGNIPSPVFTSTSPYIRGLLPTLFFSG